MSIPKNLYKQIQKLMPIACVDIIIKNDKNEFLLLKRKNMPEKGKWWFVGGRIKKGELLEKAALRKVKEETGLNVFIKRILGIDQTIFKKGPFGVSVHTIGIVFLAETQKKTEIKLDGQSAEYKWFSFVKSDWHHYVKKFLKLAGFKNKV